MTDIRTVSAPTFEEFMGDDFKVQPKPFKEQLVKDIQAATGSVVFFTKNDLRLPAIILDYELKKAQDKLSELMNDLKDGNYIVTDKELEYAKKYYEQETQYCEMVDKHVD